MEAPRDYYQSNYISGNTARHLEEMPYYSKDEYNRPLQRTKQVKKHKQKAMGIDLVSFLVLTFAVVATLIVCIQYLVVQSNVTRMSKNIAKLESSLMNLKNENNEAEENLNSSLDLAYIYKVATKELGMVHADKNQVITYESNKSEYVRQYCDVPEIK